MAKKHSSVLSASISVPMDGRVIYDYQIQNLEGRLLTLIEGLGLSEKQEKAVKDMFKGILYTALYNESVYVFGHLLDPLLRKVFEERERGTLNA